MPYLGINLCADKYNVRYKDTIKYTLTITNKSKQTVYDLTIRNLLSKLLVLNPSNIILDGRNINDEVNFCVKIGDIEPNTKKSISYDAKVPKKSKSLIICNMVICEFLTDKNDLNSKETQYSNEVIAMLKT